MTSEAEAAVLSVRDIDKSYGQLSVLKKVSFEVRRAETFAILGPNGAGKTTLFKVMTGEISGNAGSVIFQGNDITRHSAASRVRLGIGRTFQVGQIFPEYTVLENVVVAVESRRRAEGKGRLFGLDWRPPGAVREEALFYLDSVGLAGKRDVEGAYLSHGDKKRLELAIALSLKSKILMLDEPTAGMAQADRMATVDLIARIREEFGVTIVLTEHDMDVIFGLAHRLMVLNYGEVIAVGGIKDIQESEMVRKIYLGQEASHA